MFADCDYLACEHVFEQVEELLRLCKGEVFVVCSAAFFCDDGRDEFVLQGERKHDEAAGAAVAVAKGMDLLLGMFVILLAVLSMPLVRLGRLLVLILMDRCMPICQLLRRLLLMLCVLRSKFKSCLSVMRAAVLGTLSLFVRILALFLLMLVCNVLSTLAAPLFL